MSKKRVSPRDFKPHRHKQSSRAQKTEERTGVLENKVLSFLYTVNVPQSFTDMQEGFSARKGQHKLLESALLSLLQAGLVIKDAKNRYKLHKSALFYEGTLTMHPKGFGFINVSKSPSSSPSLKRDPFISAGQMGGAHHGDSVLIRVFRIRHDDRPEASVVKILSAGSNRIGGIFLKDGRKQWVEPDDRRFPFIVRIDDKSGLQPRHGDAVIAEFDRTGGPAYFLQGKIIEILGRSDNVDSQMRLVIEQFNLPHGFSEKVMRETETIEESFDPAPDREDLRATPHVTIDGEDAKDFDDAICVLKTRQGYRLIVSIADVSYFVKAGSAIDREAYDRGTSVYFPGRVIPMLPEKLSNNLCSLVPGKDRFTVSAILDFDRSATLLKKRFCRSIICSRHRFTYTTVQKILIDKEPTVRREHKTFLTQLKWAGELATALHKKRRKRGSIDFNLPEPEFTLTDSGKIESIKVAPRNFANQIIEEFMLAANQAVAELFSRQEVSAIFRVHEPPESLKAQEFVNFAKTLGLPLTPFDLSSAWFADVLEKCSGTKFEYIINNLLLRSMKQAQYAAENVGHFGLALQDYTHFTSPIRRYPDLMVHRLLLRLLQGAPKHRQRTPLQPAPKTAGDYLSNLERRAIMAERDMNDRLKAGYMKSRIGNSYPVIIAGVTENALYVEIQQLCISGSIPVEFLTDEYYLFDPKNYRLFGEITARTYQIGDIIRATVVDVDILNKKIMFSPTLPAKGNGQ